MIKSEPFAHTSGPRDAKIMFVGEAFGESEDQQKLPLVGYSGKEFWRILGDAWPDIAPKEHQFVRQCMSGDTLWAKVRHDWMVEASILFTNVFAERPPNNNLEFWCTNKADAGKDYPYPPIKQGKYIKADYFHHLLRLQKEIEIVKPNVIVCLGNIASWAILRNTGISSIRGAVAGSTMPPGYKVIPTFHPAAVMRQWAWRVVVIADLVKVRRESSFADIRRPTRRLLVHPTLDEIKEWMDRHQHCPILSVDIETKGGQITCIGFSPSPKESMTVSFWDKTKEGQNFWPTLDEELFAWQLVEEILQWPCAKLFQNGLFDLQYLMRIGLRPRNCLHDTMLLHHSIFPELNKGLGFLGSIYTDEPAWKLMRGKQAEEIKRDE